MKASIFSQFSNDDKKDGEEEDSQKSKEKQNFQLELGTN